MSRPILIKRMSEHKITLTWKRGDTPFEYQKYSRDHTWKFDGGHEMQASAAPAYLGNPKFVDPEEAFVASLSSCQMLTFLAVACKKKFVLDEYVDEAVGHMEKNAEGKLAITRVTLRPQLKFSGDKQPAAEEIEEMNHMAHEQCFIANSVKTEITIEERT
jgi:organic hydroperoxide reductase OsmC/OhrA